MAAEMAPGRNEAQLSRGCEDDIADVGGTEVEEFGRRAREEIVYDRLDVGQLRAAQGGLQVKDDAWRRNEEIAGDQGFANTAALRPFQTDIGAQAPAGPRQRGTDERIVHLGGIDHPDELIATDLLAIEPVGELLLVSGNLAPLRHDA